MKCFVTSLLLLLTACAWGQTKTVLPINPRSSTLKWTGHAEVGTYAPTGTLAIADGKIAMQDGNVTGATLTIDMKSMQQDNADLVHHLKSSDFFDVERYPTSVLSIDKVSIGAVSGTLTVKGKPAPFECPVKVTKTGDQFTISGKATLDRTRYGITYNSTSFFSGLGNKAIRNTFEVEFNVTGTGEIPSKYRQ